MDSTTKTEPEIPTEEERRRFIHDELKPLTAEQIADKRYSPKSGWGDYDPKNSRKSHWKVRQANRYLTELDRRRELWPVTLGIWVGVLAIGVAILAMPLKDSVLCHLLAWFGPGRMWLAPTMTGAGSKDRGLFVDDSVSRLSEESPGGLAALRHARLPSWHGETGTGGNEAACACGGTGATGHNPFGNCGFGCNVS